MSFTMLGRKKRAFFFDHSLHTSFFKVLPNCSGGKGLVGDIFERFGDLNCIFCLSSSDKMDDITDIGGGKLCWVATK